MSAIDFTKTELAGAIGRGVRQCIVIGSLQQPWREAFESSLERSLKVFAVDEDPQSDSPATFVPTQFASEALATALEKSDFDKQKASMRHAMPASRRISRAATAEPGDPACPAGLR